MNDKTFTGNNLTQTNIWDFNGHVIECYFELITRKSQMKYTRLFTGDNISQMKYDNMTRFSSKKTYQQTKI